MWLIKDGWRITETLEKEEKMTGGKPKSQEPSTLILLPCPEDNELNMLLKSHDINSLVKMEMAQKLTQSYSTQFVSPDSVKQKQKKAAKWGLSLNPCLSTWLSGSYNNSTSKLLKLFRVSLAGGYSYFTLKKIMAS